MPKVFFKNILQEIRHSFGRFFSILCIVMIGVAFFAGVKASAPDMKYSADQYFDKYNVQDIQVYSTLGLTQDDLKEIKKIDGVEDAEPVFSIDTLTQKDSTQLVMKVISLADDQSINKVRLVDGRMPKKENECIIEAGSVSNQLFGNFEIGDTITLTSGTEDDLSDTLKNTEYTVVGTCYNPNYLSYEKGSSSIGNGEVGNFMYVKDSNIKVDYFTEIDVTVKGAKDINTYDDAYFDSVEPVVDKIKAISDDRIDARIGENQKEIDDAQKELDEQINDAQAQIDDGYAQIQDGYAQIQSNEQQLVSAKAQLDSGWAEYYQNITVLDNIPTLEQAIAQIEQGEASLPGLQANLEQINTNLANIEEDYQLATANYQTLLDTRSDLEQLLQTVEDEDIKKQITTKLNDINKQIVGAEQVINAYTTLNTSKAQVEDAINQINSGIAQKPTLIAQRDQLYAARDQLNAAYNELVSGQAEYESGLAQLNDAKNTLSSSLSELEQSQNQLNTEKTENQQKIDDAQSEIDKLEAEWITLDRNSHYSYRDYGACADRMDGIAQVFPVFFFLVAALVCMTTMTRMVDEQRNEIGTLKALGYSKVQISSKYLLYALIASILGSILGCLVGMILFPYVIFTAWNTLYNLETIKFAFQPGLMLVASGSVIGITLLATLYSIYSELIEVPSQLMRPKAAKIGKKIILERIPFIWNHLSFLRKVTARNIFRYKKRFFMTVIGIAGCSALLVAGFGINDSISDIVHQQYEVINHFEASINVSNIDDNFEQTLKKQKGVTDIMEEDTLPVTANIADKDASVTVHIVDDKNLLKDFTTLKSINDDQEVSLNSKGAVISQKMAEKMEKGIGDTITFKDANDNEIEVKITDIYENYVGHNIYVTRDLYDTWNSNAELTKTYLLKTNDTSDDFEHQLGQKLMDINGVDSITFYSSLQENFTDMIASISMVVVVLVISAAALAFVVLYNLSNVNISERTREIATIKVLGFTSRETSQYVNRESILLTMIGAAVGLIVGIFLHNLIMNLAEMDDVMFGRTIKPISFVISFALTMVFAIIINLVMQRKLKQIQMVESLKAVE